MSRAVSGRAAGAGERRGLPILIAITQDTPIMSSTKRLSDFDRREAVVFKGGTSLSKAHGVIERFSENIDLAIRGGHDLGDAQRRALMRSIERMASQDLTYLKGRPLKTKHGRFRKTAYSFPTSTDNAEFAQIADKLLSELNSFADPEPSAIMPIGTLIHDFLAGVDRTDLIRQLGLERFRVQMFCVERTLCEKIMGLVRASHIADSIAGSGRRIRHFYDIVLIMRSKELREFVDSDAFVDLFEEVGECDRRSMPGAAAWLDPPLGEAMIVTDAGNLWCRIRSEFHGNFKDMVYRDSVPDNEEVLSCFASIGE